MSTAIQAIFNTTDASETNIDSFAVVRALSAFEPTDTSETSVLEVDVIKALRSRYQYSGDSSDTACSPAIALAIRSVDKTDTAESSALAVHVQAVAAIAATDSSETNVEFLVRRHPALPPSGKLQLLGIDGYKPFHKATLIVGKSYTLAFELRGERLTGIGVRFKATPTNNEHAQAITKSTDPREGGVELGEETPETISLGAIFERRGTIDLYSADSRYLQHPTLYSYQLEAIGSIGEPYLIESGKFLFSLVT